MHKTEARRSVARCIPRFANSANFATSRLLLHVLGANSNPHVNVPTPTRVARPPQPYVLCMHGRAVGSSPRRPCRPAQPLYNTVDTVISADAA